MVALIGDLMSLGHVYSGQYSIISHTLIFSNLGGILIVFFMLIRRQYVNKYEILGTAIALVGCLLTVSDGKAKKVNEAEGNMLLGNCIAFGASVCAAFYYTAN